jgi:uncharacterized DUF497 family protein
VIYEWDPEKANTNLGKHHVSFEQAAQVFLDPLALTFSDPRHSGQDEREITIGRSEPDQVVFVSHCQRGKRIRIISARKATKREIKQYEEGIG